MNATTHDGASALDMSHVAAARHRRNDAGRATGHDALAELLVAHGATRLSPPGNVPDPTRVRPAAARSGQLVRA